MIASSVFFSVINFGLFIALAGWALRRPVRIFFRDRREAVAGDLLLNETRLREARDHHFRARHRLQHLDEEIAELTTAIRKLGEKDREEIKQRAHDTAERYSSEAKRHAEREAVRQQEIVRHELLLKAFDLALERLKEESSPGAQGRYVLLALQALEGLSGFGKTASPSSAVAEVRL